MLLSRKELQKMSPIEAEYVYAYILELYREKVTPDTTNYENLNASVNCCPKCGSKHVIKWGYNYGKKSAKQRYLCKDCKRTYVPTSGTVFAYSNTSYHDWIDFIACEINSLTLEQEVITISKSKTTCFNMRHKLYDALSDIQDRTVLHDEIELDPTYEKINLKGTKPVNMPRISKKRGRSQKSKRYSEKNLRGISHHKVCLISAIDSHDNVFFKIAGLGAEDKAKLDPFREHFKSGSSIICDEKACLRTFAYENGMTAEVIPTTGYKSPKGKTLADINQIHQMLSDLNKKKHGVSTRHLPGYLNWLVFCKQLKYRIDGKRRKVESYLEAMKKQISITTINVCKVPMPIDLRQAYEEFHYGVFNDHQLLS